MNDRVCVGVEGFADPYLVRFEQLRTEDRGVRGVRAWADPAPPPEPWSGSFFATRDVLFVGPKYREVMSANCRFVFDPAVVPRALVGDSAWLPGDFDDGDDLPPDGSSGPELLAVRPRKPLFSRLSQVA